MISNAPITNIAYYTREFATDDYYNKGQNPEGVGVWSGKALDQFRELKNDRTVDKRDFNNLISGINPETGKKLNHQVRNLERTNNGAESKARTGHDFTLNANKDYTLLMNVYPSDSPEYKKLEEGFNKANEYLVNEIESNLKVRENGKYETSRGVAVATYTHETARPVDGKIDPHKHKHNVFMPYGLDSQGKFKALEFEKVLEKKMEIGSQCQSIMAQTVRDLGFKVIEGKTGWEIEGIDRETVKQFSGREEQITKLAGEHQDFNSRSEIAKIKEGKGDYKLSDLQGEWKTKLEKLQLTPKTLNRLRDPRNKDLPVASKEDVYKRASKISKSNFFGAQDINTALKQLSQFYKVDEKNLKDEIFKNDKDLLKNCGPSGKFGKPLHTHKSLWSSQDFNKLVQVKEMNDKPDLDKIQSKLSSKHTTQRLNDFVKRNKETTQNKPQDILNKNREDKKSLSNDPKKQAQEELKSKEIRTKTKSKDKSTSKAKQNDKQSELDKLKTNAFVSKMTENTSTAKIKDPEKTSSSNDKVQAKPQRQEAMASVGSSMSSNARQSVDSATSAVAQAQARLGSMSVSDPQYIQALLASYQAQATLQNALAELGRALKQEADKLEKQRAQERQQYQMT